MNLDTNKIYTLWLIEITYSGLLIFRFFFPSFPPILLFYFLYFKKILFIYFGGEGREKERERNINVVSVWLLLVRPPTGDLAYNPGMGLIGNWTGNPLVHRSALNPLNHTSQGSFFFLTNFFFFYSYNLKYIQNVIFTTTKTWNQKFRTVVL